MYYITTIKQELSTAKIYAHTLLYEMSVVDRHLCHMAAKFSVPVDEDQCKLLCSTGYLYHIKYPMRHVLLLILVYVHLMSFLQC